MKNVNCDTVCDLLEDRSSKHRKSMQTNSLREKYIRIYKKISPKSENGITLKMFTSRRNSAAVTSCTNKHKTLRPKIT